MVSIASVLVWLFFCISVSTLSDGLIPHASGLVRRNLRGRLANSKIYAHEVHVRVLCCCDLEKFRGVECAYVVAVTVAVDLPVRGEVD